MTTTTSPHPTKGAASRRKKPSWGSGRKRSQLTAKHYAFASRPGATPRTPTVIQMENVECGAASLGIMLAHHGLHVPLEELRAACGVSRDGASAKNVLAAAESYGMECHGRRMEIEPLMQLGEPAIIFWAFQHFLVVEGFERSRGRIVVRLNDPAAGPRKMSLEEFDEGFTGIVLTMSPGPEFSRSGKPESVMSMLFQRMTGSGRALPLAFFASLVLVVPGLLSPALSRYFVDVVYHMRSVEALIPVVIGLIGCGVASIILTSVQTRAIRLAEVRHALTGSARFFSGLITLPISFFMQRQAGELIRRVGSNFSVAQTITRDLVISLINVLLMSVYGAMLIVQDWVLGVLAISVALTNFIVLRMMLRQRVDAAIALEAEEAQVAVTTLHTIGSIETVKSSGTESVAFTRWSGFLAKATTVGQRLGKPAALLSALPPTIATLNTGLVILLGGLRVADGYLTVGVLLGFQLLLAGFTRPLSHLINQAGELQELRGQLMRLRDADAFTADPRFDQNSTIERRFNGELTFSSVTFAFSPLAPPQVDRVSLTVKPGMRVAVVGRSGSGKSTVGRLAAGLLTPTSGEVLYDGLPPEMYSRRAFAMSVSYVDQKCTLFEGTIRDNVCFWSEAIPDEAVAQALRDASIYDEVMRRPGGINSHVEEGGRNFSGGQRQRLEIARALVTDPTLLILDEATAALDPLAEKTVMDGLRRRGAALLIIAHRLSTIRDADVILVVDEGKIVEVGRHDQLLVLGGLYAELVSSGQTKETP